jgi:hypothetical protein
MSISVICGSCGKQLRTKDQYAGWRMQCPQCKTMLQLPTTPDPPGPAVSPPDVEAPTPPAPVCPLCGKDFETDRDQVKDRRGRLWHRGCYQRRRPERAKPTPTEPLPDEEEATYRLAGTEPAELPAPKPHAHEGLEASGSDGAWSQPTADLPWLPDGDLLQSNLPSDEAMVRLDDAESGLTPGMVKLMKVAVGIVALLFVVIVAYKLIFSGEPASEVADNTEPPAPAGAPADLPRRPADSPAPKATGGPLPSQRPDGTASSKLPVTANTSKQPTDKHDAEEPTAPKASGRASGPAQPKPPADASKPDAGDDNAEEPSGTDSAEHPPKMTGSPEPAGADGSRRPAGDEKADTEKPTGPEGAAAPAREPNKEPPAAPPPASATTGAAPAAAQASPPLVQYFRNPRQWGPAKWTAVVCYCVLPILLGAVALRGACQFWEDEIPEFGKALGMTFFAWLVAAGLVYGLSHLFPMRAVWLSALVVDAVLVSALYAVSMPTSYGKGAAIRAAQYVVALLAVAMVFFAVRIVGHAGG